MSIISVISVLLLAGVCSATPVSRIVGGTPTSVETYPSIVQLDFYLPSSNTWSQFCGGSILNQVYVLSAARCTDVRNDPNYTPDNRRIRAGATFKNTGGVINNVASVTIHPDYNVQTFLDADICLIRLRDFLVFGNQVNSIAILQQGFVVPDNAPVIHAGWGSVGDGEPAEELLFVNLVHRSDCNGAPPAFLTEYKICSGSLPGTDGGVCGGDFGGPLYYEGFLAGVVSWGPSDCTNSSPTISAKVASFTDWIVENAV